MKKIYYPTAVIILLLQAAFIYSTDINTTTELSLEHRSTDLFIWSLENYSSFSFNNKPPLTFRTAFKEIFRRLRYKF